MQNAVLELRFDAIAIDIFRQREYPLVIAIGVFVVDPLVASMIVSATASADRQHPPLQGDVDPVRGDTRHLGEHHKVVARFVNIGGRQEHRAWRHAPSAIGRLRRLLIDSSDFLGHVTLLGQGHAGRIWIFLGRSASSRSSSISRMPLLKRAWTLSASTRNGSWTAREKLP